MTPDPCHINRLAAATIRRNAIDLADQRYLMDVCGLVAPDGSIPPDDTRVIDVRELEAK